MKDCGSNLLLLNYHSQKQDTCNSFTTSSVYNWSPIQSQEKYYLIKKKSKENVYWKEKSIMDTKNVLGEKCF